MQVLSALDTLKEIASQHENAINHIVTPILDDRDIVSTCQRYLALVRDPRFPREYATIRATLESELTTEPRPNETMLNKIKAVLSDLGQFQYAAFMLEYDSWRMADHVEAASELWSLLSAQNHREPSTRITELQTTVRMSFQGSFQWLIAEQQEWLPEKQQQQISVPNFELTTPHEVVELVRLWCKHWQRHIQKTLHSHRGLFYTISQLREEYARLQESRLNSGKERATPINQTDTEGGAFVAGDAHIGHDLIGRDQIITTHHYHFSSKEQVDSKASLGGKVLAERFSLLTAFSSRLQKVMTNLNRLRAGQPVPDGFIVQNELVPLTEIFEDLEVYQLLLGEEFYTLLLKQAQLALRAANVSSEKDWIMIAQEMRRTWAEIRRKGEAVFNLGKTA